MKSTARCVLTGFFVFCLFCMFVPSAPAMVSPPEGEDPGTLELSGDMPLDLSGNNFTADFVLTYTNYGSNSLGRVNGALNVNFDWQASATQVVATFTVNGTLELTMDQQVYTLVFQDLVLVATYIYSPYQNLFEASGGLTINGFPVDVAAMAELIYDIIL